MKSINPLTKRVSKLYSRTDPHSIHSALQGGLVRTNQNGITQARGLERALCLPPLCLIEGPKEGYQLMCPKEVVPLWKKVLVLLLGHVPRAAIEPDPSC